MQSIEVLFEDQDIVVVAKPSGVVTNRAKSVAGETLQDWFAKRQQGKSFPDDWQSQLPDDFSIEYGSPAEIYRGRQGMVHRLDKDTSGVMVFAKQSLKLTDAVWSATNTKRIPRAYPW